MRCSSFRWATPEKVQSALLRAGQPRSRAPDWQGLLCFVGVSVDACPPAAVIHQHQRQLSGARGSKLPEIAKREGVFLQRTYDRCLSSPVATRSTYYSWTRRSHVRLRTLCEADRLLALQRRHPEFAKTFFAPLQFLGQLHMVQVHRHRHHGQPAEHAGELPASGIGPGAWRQRCPPPLYVGVLDGITEGMADRGARLQVLTAQQSAKRPLV